MRHHQAAIVKGFISGLVVAFRVQANLELTPIVSSKGKIQNLTKDVNFYCGAQIDMSGQVRGEMYLYFHHQTYLRIMSNMLGETFTTLTPDIADGAGEFTNIAFGHVKTAVNKTNEVLKMARPKVVSGNDLVDALLHQKNPLTVSFDTELGAVYMALVFQQKAAA